MADVDMTDAPSTSSGPVKRPVSKAKTGVEGGDGKKRFEVKKVDFSGQIPDIKES
jgi:E3 ubiquitin-protein ligase RBX1